MNIFRKADGRAARKLEEQETSRRIRDLNAARRAIGYANVMGNEDEVRAKYSDDVLNYVRSDDDAFQDGQLIARGELRKKAEQLRQAEADAQLRKEAGVQ